MTTLFQKSSGKPARSAGFTLVEMLVVVVIVAILAGIVLHLIKMVQGYNAKAVTIQRIEKVRACLEEFFAEYGQYPPVPSYGGSQPVMYEYPNSNSMCANPALANLIGTKNDDGHRVFTFGLMSFLVTRYAGHADQAWRRLLEENPQWGLNNQTIGDQDRDVKAIRRWSPWLSDDVISGDDRPYTYTDNGPTPWGYTNKCVTVKDGWDHELRYKSAPPHQTYDLWSAGPDGADGGPLDAIADQKAAADDIHSAPGH